MKDEDLKAARKKIEEEQKKGKNIRNSLKEAKRIASGVVFKSGTTRLGKTVFQVCEEHHVEQERIKMEKIKDQKETCIKPKNKLDALMATGKDYNKMNIQELKTILKPY